MVLSRDTARHDRKRRPDPTESDFEKVIDMPTIAERGFLVGERRAFWPSRGDGALVVAIVERTLSEEHVWKGPTKERWNIVTVYTAPAGKLASMYSSSAAML